MRLILTADDFGKDVSITNAIIECFRRDYITETSLMVNMPDTERAVLLARNLGVDNRIGLHLNLIEGRPLTENIRNFSNWCDSIGNFNNQIGKKPLFYKVDSTDEQKALESEIVAQVDRYNSFNLGMLHCDGHQHCHRRNAIYTILFPILQDYRFKSIRRPNNVELTRFNFFKPALRARILNWTVTRQMRKAGFFVADYMDGYEQIANIMRRMTLDNHTIEIMLHPSYDTANNLVNLYESKKFPISSIIKAFNTGKNTYHTYGSLTDE